MLAIFILAGWISSISAIECKSFQCRLPDQSFTLDTCIFWDQDSNGYFLQECGFAAPYCPTLSPSDPSNSTCLALPETNINVWPGEKCHADSDCNEFAEDGCKNGVCQGTREGDSCNSTDYCHPGLYCNKIDLCKPLLSDGNSGCESDYDCENNLGCDIDKNNELTGICRPYFSILPHEQVRSCTNNQNSLCSSSMCAVRLADNQFYCTQKISSNSKNTPTTCQTDNDCASIQDPFFPMTFFTSCTCGYNADATAFCGLFPEDNDYKRYLTLQKDWYQSSAIKNCNSIRRKALNCISDWWNTDSATSLTYYTLKLSNWASIQNNDICVSEIYELNYNLWKKAYEKIADEDENDDKDDIAVCLYGLSYMILIFN